MKESYGLCSTCQRLKEQVTATGREYSRAVAAMFDARESDRYAAAAEAADTAHLRFLQARAGLEKHLESGGHDQPVAGGSVA